VSRLALIVGAGIGGLTAALALARAGYHVLVLERAPRIEEVGAGLQISPNALRVLAKLGLMNALSAVASQPECVTIRRGRDGRVLSRLPLGETAVSRWGAPSLTLHRADLQAILLEAAKAEPAIDIRPGHEVTGFALDGETVVVAARVGLIRLSFQCDLLIGADGLRSVVREKLNVPAAPRYTGQHAWRALIPIENVPKALHKNETSLWLGPKTHLVHYPLRGGRVMNVVAIVEAGQEQIGNSWSETADPARLHSAFARWNGQARALLHAAPEWRRWQLFDRDPTPQWGDGPVTLLGDAAHPMLPFLAQGASQAIEDAAVLARHLAGGGTAPQAMRDYEAARFARTARVQLEARRQARIYHLSGPAAFARDMAMRLMGTERLLARYDWLYQG